MATVASHRPNPPPEIEVRCAGCSQTLEVDPGLTEFICPDCGTPQALPPELMPRKRKALPLPRGVDSSKIQLPCGSCATLLNVPHGLARFACPRCAVELAVDQERLKGYLTRSSEDAPFVMPSAVRLPCSVDVEPPTQTRIHKSIPTSMASVPCRLNNQHIEDEAEERVPTPPTKKAVSKQTKLKEKQSTSFTTKELELLLKHSKRMHELLTPLTKKKQRNQSQQNEDLFPPDNNPVSPTRDPESPIQNPASQIPDSTDDDEVYVAESDSSPIEPDWRRKPEPDLVLQKALEDAQKRRGLVSGRRETSTNSNRGKRGPSKCLEIWNRSETDRAEIEFNNAGQPVGDLSCAFGNFLGSIARDGKLVPINYTEWKAVPGKFKDVVWYIVKSKCTVEEGNRSYVIQAVGRRWVNWKSTLKSIHYDVHDNDDARLADIDSRIEPDQWPFLVEFWGSDEGKKRSEASKALRAKHKTYHTTGTKSFARIREEERLRRANKEEPSRAEVFILTHTRKDGTPIDEESARIIDRLREELAKASSSNSETFENDILAKVLGKKRHMNTYGILPTQPDYSSGHSEEPARLVRKRLAEEESRPMKEQMKAMERRHKEMEMEMKIMRQAMAISGMALPRFGGSFEGGDGKRAISGSEGSLSQ